MTDLVFSNICDSKWTLRDIDEETRAEVEKIDAVYHHAPPCSRVMNDWDALYETLKQREPPRNPILDQIDELNKRLYDLVKQHGDLRFECSQIHDGEDEDTKASMNKKIAVLKDALFELQKERRLLMQKYYGTPYTC